MYGNEVIESLNKMLTSLKNARRNLPNWDNNPDKNLIKGIAGKNAKVFNKDDLYIVLQEGNDYITKDIITKLQQAHHFHINETLGNVGDFLKKCSKDNKGFLGELAFEVNMPFDLCWIDFEQTADASDEALKSLDLYDKDIYSVVSKNGLMVNNISFNGNTFLRMIMCGTSYLGYGRIEWGVTPLIMYIKVGSVMTVDEANHFHDIEYKNFNFSYPYAFMKKYITDFFNNIAIKGMSQNTFIIPTVTRSFDKFTKDDGNYFQHSVLVASIMLNVLNMFLMTLNCKNVEPVNQYHLKKFVNSKGKVKYIEMKNKFQYKILELVVPPTKNKTHINETGSEPSHQKRIHFCRGNYATYTEDKPLFGHWVGRIWRNSSVKGSKEKGVVVKEYDVTEKKINI